MAVYIWMLVDRQDTQPIGSQIFLAKMGYIDIILFLFFVTLFLFLNLHI